MAKRQHFPTEVRARAFANDPRAAAMRDSARVKRVLNGLWTDRSFQPHCWNTVVAEEYEADYAQELRQQDPYTGRLFILADEHTASASEQFIAMLKDANAATVIGTKTMGVGCGYTNGGIDIKLRNSGLVIRMPDCARLRRDGSNEYEGIEPDVAVDWNGGDKAAVLVRALGGS